MDELARLRDTLTWTERLTHDGDDASTAKDADHLDLRGSAATAPIV